MVEPCRITENMDSVSCCRSGSHDTAGRGALPPKVDGRSFGIQPTLEGHPGGCKPRRLSVIIAAMKFPLFCTLPGLVRHASAGCLLLLQLMSLLLLLFPVLPAEAGDVAGLNEALVVVNSRDDERERQQGFSTALREVLVKLTGRTDTNANPLIVRALAAPQSYVETWTYRSLPAGNPAQPEQIGMQVTYFQAGLQQLLNDAGIPVWPQNRPDTLLWVTVQDELGERYLAAPLPADGGEVLEQLQGAAVLRGVPLLLPLLDFEDLRALPLEQLWNFDIETLRRAALRYLSESILAVRVFRSLRGDVIGRAVYLFRDRVLEFEALESPLDSFLAGSLDMVAQELAAHYAILLSGVDNSTEVLLTVDGLRNPADYAGLLQYLGGIAAVNGVQLLGVEGGSVQLQLRTGGQFRQLIESIALDRRMSAIGEVSRSGQQVFMHYQWRSQQP